MSIVTYNNRSIANISAIPGAAKSLTHIKTLTASSSSTLSFVNGSDDVVLDSTYPIYLFKFISIHAGAQGGFSFNFRDGSTDYDATKTTTHLYAYQNEAGNSTGLTYTAGYDIAQGTGFQRIGDDLTTDNDHTLSGEMFLFNPSSTTFVKHFMLRTQIYESDNYSESAFIAGYCNTTSAVNAVQFKPASGNIDAGVIKMYGVS